MEKKTFTCKYCGKEGFPNTFSLGNHYKTCSKKPKEIRRRKTKKVLLGNVVYIPMALALNFSNQTFEIVSMNDVQGK